MYCQKCSLHYPDHLNFCRRCGQTLVRSNSETATESTCCTRCGARGVRGENFCQHCGNRTGVTLQETVIGACYHCGTSWRSGWLFCKTCGLDRKRALLLSTSTPSAESLNTNIPQQIEEFVETSTINCKTCGTEAKPYSRFCEVCGGRFEADKPGQPSLSTSTATVPTSNESQSDKAVKQESYRSPSPTIFEPPTPKPTPASTKPATQVEKSETSSETSNDGPESFQFDPTLLPTSPMPDAKRKLDAASAQTVLSENAASSGSLGSPIISGQQSGKLKDSPESDGGANSKTVVTPLPPFGGEFRHKEINLSSGTWARNRQAIIQSGVLIGLVIILILFVFWWLSRDTLNGIDGLSSRTQTSGQAQKQAASNATAAIASLPENMIFIPGGKFQMGRPDGDEYETPVHTVSVSPFFLGRTEVTNQEYQRFISETGHRPPTHWQNGKFPPNEANLPVVNVSWNDANDFAKWAGKRLPTETEWEFAARGAEGRLYPWGNNWSAANANAGRDNGGRISEVGRFPNGASPFGILDMCGNVWEWTSSNLVSYANGNEMAPGKVIRGGAFDAPSERATATYRGVLPADRLRDKTGFRLARDAQANP